MSAGQPPRRSLRGPAVLLLLALALGAFSAARFRLDSDLSHFLPEGEDARLARIQRALADSPQARTLLLVLRGPSLEAAVEAGRQLEAALADDPEVETVLGGLPAGRREALERLAFPRRAGLADPPEDPEAAAEAVVARLLLPQDAAARRRLLADPAFAWERYLQGLQRGEGRGLSLVDGRFAGGGGAVLILRTRHAPFDYAAQAPFLARLAAVALPPGVSLDRAGAHPFAVQAETDIRASVSRIATASTLGVILLFLLAFRSPRALALALLPAGFGVLAGLAATLALFGDIHGLTLAFGASLLGVCIDYPVHLLGHHRGEEPAALARRLRPGLLLGAGTTVAGFAGLIVTGFPGLREIALFAGVGVLAALGATLYGLPPLLGRPRPPLPELALPMPRRAAGVLVLLALAACALGLPRLRWDDSVASLSALDPALQDEEARAQGAVAQWDAGRLAVVFGRDVTAALPGAFAVSRGLGAAQASGALGSWSSASDLLPPPGLQRRRAEAARAAWPAFEAALAARGLRPEAFEPPGLPPPLGVEDLRRAGLAELIEPFVVPIPGGTALITLLAGVGDAEAVRGAVEAVSGAVYFDQQAFLDGIFGAYRARTGRLVLAGLVAVLLVLLLRYRRPGEALAAFAPAVLAAGVALSALALFGQRPNLLHLASTLLVLSIGVDFGIFLVEQRRHPRGFGASLLSISVASGTTVLSLGTLALSPQPALQAIGGTTALGVLAALVLAPACVALLGPRGEGA